MVEQFITVFHKVISELDMLYYKYTRDIRTKYSALPVFEDEKKRFFKKKKVVEVNNPYTSTHCSSASLLYNFINYIDRSTDIKFEKSTRYFNDFLQYVKSFCDFIIFADIELFYFNDESSTVYAEEISKEKKTIYFKFAQFKVKFTFEQTEVPLISEKFSILEEPKDSKLTMIYIEIMRSYGKQFVNSCKFVDGEDIKFSNPDSEIMFTIVAHQVKEAMIETFQRILQKAICQYFNINDHQFNLGDFIETQDVYIDKDKEQT